jgi:hypothetical protein
MISKIVFGFIKPSLDAHTLGINSISEMIRECGYKVFIAPEDIENSIISYNNDYSLLQIVKWIKLNNITQVGISYRLDGQNALEMVQALVMKLEAEQFYGQKQSLVQKIFFAGLPSTCKLIEAALPDKVVTFSGGESFFQTLKKLGVDENHIPNEIVEGSLYDEHLHSLAKKIIDGKEYLKFSPIDRSSYPEYGTKFDSIVKRVSVNKHDDFLPLSRVHVGPYYSSKSRIDSVNEFKIWAKSLATTGYLDVLSIGSSQLTQSNFNEDWKGKMNGGGVPINSPAEYKEIWELSRPLLLRTYAGTKNIPSLAKIHEETINIAWHALSIWWFNKLDERGPYGLLENLQQHFDTIKYIATTNKPFEPNVPHHFAFRGADDVTYVVSEYLSAKLAKKLGVKYFIFQNMMNTPRYTWGVQDLAKSRAILSLLEELKDDKFEVFLQPRAGLDYFKSDLYEAKIQLASVSMMMDDIIPDDFTSPDIIHVVSYSEASHLANPEIIDESIQITQYSIKKYRELKREKLIDTSYELDVLQRKENLLYEAKLLIAFIESQILDLYSPIGFYKVFAAGFLPVPYLWMEKEEFKYAIDWKTKLIKGSVKIVNIDGSLMSINDRIARATQYLRIIEERISSSDTRQ